ncbi:MAG: o-succinylbenzoate synthase, partial [Nitrospinota bacterium]
HRSVGPLLEEVAGGIAEGYRRVKIKIKPGWDKEPLCAIRERFGDFPLFPDANSAYELKKHLGVFRELDTLDLMMVEQPLHHEDLVDHARLQREIKTPVCLDESVHSAAQARGAIELGSCRIVNVKIQRVGGLGQALRIHDLCRGKGIGLWCGTMPETGLGQAQGLALASLPGFTHPADLEPSARFFPEDVVDPPLVLDAEGRLPVPQGEGTGVEVRMDVVEKYKVAHLTLSP